MSRQKLLESCINSFGSLGNMVSYSKGQYRYDNPKNLVVFNANIYSPDFGKIWYGDIDLTEKHRELRDLSMEYGTPLYVLYEMDGRFENEDVPALENYVVKATAGTLKLKESAMEITDLEGNVVKASGFYYIHSDGSPKVYTSSEHKKINLAYYKALAAIDSKRTKEEMKLIKPDDYTAIKLNIKYSLKSKYNPLSQLYKKFIKLCGDDKDKAQELFDSLVWTRKEEKAFEQALVKWIKVHHKGLSKYRIDKEVAWMKLETPRNFRPKDPKWATGKFYLEKDKK